VAEAREAIRRNEMNARIAAPKPQPIVRKVQEDALIQKPTPRATRAYVRSEIAAFTDALIEMLKPEASLASLLTSRVRADLEALAARVSALEKPRVRVKALSERST
jgi:hypothetical protein